MHLADGWSWKSVRSTMAFHTINFRKPVLKFSADPTFQMHLYLDPSIHLSISKALIIHNFHMDCGGFWLTQTLATSPPLHLPAAHAECGPDYITICFSGLLLSLLLFLYLVSSHSTSVSLHISSAQSI